MRKLFTVLVAVLLTATLWAQAPQKMSYQAVIRNSSDVLVISTQIGMEINIRQGSETGTVVYTETQTPTTNANGLVSIEIGGAGFSAINWEANTYYIETKTAIVPPLTTYTITGVSQLLSVPYALHAKTADAITGGVTETDPIFGAWNKSTGISITESQISDLNHFTNADETDPVFNASVASGITATDTTNWNNKLDTEVDGSVTNEIQNLSSVLTQSNDGNASQIKNIANPTDAQDAATKAYIDNMLINAGVFTVTDYDGNVYNTVKIGNQVWMKENLKVTHYNDGIAIPPVTDNTAWGNLTTPAYCWYNNDQATYGNTYGALYNWFTVQTGNVCPTGWHEPTDAEWTTMENYLIANGYNYDGTTTGNKIAKSLGATTTWNASGTAGAVGNTDYPAYRNKSNFTALAGGYRNDYGTFTNIGYNGIWWSATETVATYAWYRDLYYNGTDVYRGYGNEESGFSVRCVRD